MNCVYRIECLDKNIKEFYIGSTKDLHKRRIKHKHRCNNSNSSKYNYKVYQFIRENGGWENWQIVVEYETKCYDKWNRCLLEQSYKDDFEPELNMVNALGKDMERRRIGINKNNKNKANCTICDKEMNKSSINRHIKSQHSN
tara:strand:- start:43 stop:468 length:426 start_codon:yes stop_codon:yes gene_type:complete